VRSMCLHGISCLFAEILRVSSTLPMCLQVSTFLHCGFTILFSFILFAFVIDRLMNTGLRIKDACPLKFWRIFNDVFSMFRAFFMFCSTFVVCSHSIFKLHFIFIGRWYISLGPSQNMAAFLMRQKVFFLIVSF
jgi:hypothetical protein